MPVLDLDYILEALDNADVPIIGLTPTFDWFRKAVDESAVTPPAISEMTNPAGHYKFTFDWEGKLDAKNNDILFRVDLGVAVSNRYIDGRISPRDLGISAIIGQLGLLKAKVIWDDGGTKIDGVITEIRDTTDTNDLIQGLVSDTNGEVAFSLPPNNPSLLEKYKVYGFKAAVTFSNPYSIELTADGQSFILAATETTIGVPTAPDATRLFDFAIEPDGITPLKAIDAFAEIINLPYDSGSELHSGDKIKPDSFNAVTGEFYWDIVQGSRVRICVAELGLNKVLDVPVTPNPARITDLAGV